MSRDLKHRQNPTDPISKFIILNNLSWPEMEIIEDNLTIVKGLEREDYWKISSYRKGGLFLIQ